MSQSSQSPETPGGPGKQPTSGATSKATVGGSKERRPRGRWKRWLIGSGIGIGVIALLGAIGAGVAEHYTSQPESCASCHIMSPYYESWKQDLHGEKLEVACVECHYAPGERTTLKAKFRGLSQLMSYWSGRYGKTRPRAYVPQASCMTSNCHGDEEFMDKPLRLGTVEFVHAKHLKLKAEDKEAAADRRAELAEQLRKQLGDERFAELRSMARKTGPAEQRYRSMVLQCRTWGEDIERQTLVEFSQLEHREVRHDQLQNLQCTDCHSYSHRRSDFPGLGRKHHFQVTGAACYTCHLGNEAFNTGSAECMLCHDPPQGEITVHGPLSEGVREKLGTTELGREPIRMDHTEIVARNQDCRACHADVVVGDAGVTVRDCERCHDQHRFYEDWDKPLDVDLVARYHAVHVPQQRAKCLDCHSEIQHRLFERDEQLGQRSFLSAAINECTRCHPAHHREQLQMLVGSGGETVPHGDSNMMFGARTNCYGCHSELEDVDGQEVMVATKGACVACHSEEYGEIFEQWKMVLDLTLGDAEKAYQAARRQLDESNSVSDAARGKAEKLLAAAEADLRLVRLGNGVHNITYALQLLDGVVAHCQKAEEALLPEQR